MADEIVEETLETTEAVETKDEGLLSSAREVNTEVGDEGDKVNTDGDKPAERPDFIDDRFWNKEGGEVNLEALAKSQRDFEKMARGKVGDVPDSADGYEIKYDGEVLSDDPIITASKEIALKHGIPKEQFEAFMADFVGVSLDSAPTLDLDAERAKLGDRADNVIAAVNTWVDNLESKGLLSEHEREAMLSIGNTAEGVKALNKIRTHYTRGETIPTQISTDDGAMSADEYYQAVGSEKYANDPSYRATVKKQAQRIFGTTAAGSSRGGLGV